MSPLIALYDREPVEIEEAAILISHITTLATISSTLKSTHTNAAPRLPYVLTRVYTHADSRRFVREVRRIVKGFCEFGYTVSYTKQHTREAITASRVCYRFLML